MNYLLDTNAASRSSMEATCCPCQISKAKTQEPRFSCLPSPCLNFGTALQRVRVENSTKKRLEVFVAGPVHALPFEDVDAELAGAIELIREHRKADRCL